RRERAVIQCGVDAGEAVVFGSGHSSRTEAREAAAEVCARAQEMLRGRDTDLCTVFFSHHHAGSAAEIAAESRDRRGPRRLRGCTGEGVLGASADLERRPGLALLAGSMPGARLTAFSSDDLLSDDPARSGDEAA